MAFSFTRPPVGRLGEAPSVRVALTWLRVRVGLLQFSWKFFLRDEGTLSDLIPFVCMQEHCTIKGDIEGKHINVVILDGTQ